MNTSNPVALFAEPGPHSPPDAGGQRAHGRAPRILRKLPIRSRPVDPARLRILVVGTPKTGNTWIKHLLSVLYQLPVVELKPRFSDNNWSALGPRWIGQQHYDPTGDVLDLTRDPDVVFVAPVRHPGDVLVSLRHYVEKRGQPPSETPLEPDFMRHDPPLVYGPHTLSFLRNGFPLLLHLSIYWLRGGWALSVRYRDLWRFPVETLQHLADQILPLSRRELEHAICACEADLMRRTVNPSGDLVRKGGIGSWMTDLPPEVRSCLEQLEPYPDQFAALGFSMDASHPDNLRSVEPAPVTNPFQGRDTFANGVPISLILMRAFFDQSAERTAPWSNATTVGPGTYHDWLKGPAAADPHGGREAPVVTELAAYLRSRRPDLLAAFPDPFGADRVRFCHWFIFNALGEFDFDRSFTLPVLASWARGPADKEPPEFRARTGT